MYDLENANYAACEENNIAVLVCPELLEADDCANELWGLCIRIENNSAEKIRLVRREFCITDCNGCNRFDYGEGFHGEMPDLESAEYFEYEDTLTVGHKAAVLYGCCYALTADNREIKIQLPIIEINQQTVPNYAENLH